MTGSAPLLPFARRARSMPLGKTCQVSHVCTCVLLVTGLGVLLLTGCAHNPQQALDRAGEPFHSGLAEWIDTELAPYLVERLGGHPRFRGEPFLLVKMNGADVQPDIDELTSRVRNRLLDALVQAPGASPVWRPTVRPWRHHRSLEDVDCNDLGSLRYYVGIEVRREQGRRIGVSVRALDIGGGAWVNGFGLSWQGEASKEELVFLGRRHTDEYLRGLRVLPFSTDQADLVAAYLARNLSCLLRQRQIDEVIVFSESPPGGHPIFDTSLRLLGNYLARFREVRVSDERGAANVLVRGEVHGIDASLYQVWVVTRFKEGGEHLAGTDTAAYVTVHGGTEQAAVDPGTPVRYDLDEPPPAPGSEHNPRLPIVAGLRVLEPRFPNMCATRNPWAWGAREWEGGEALLGPRCYAVELEVVRAARIFLMRHSPTYRVLRLLPASCREGGTLSHQLSAGETLRFPRMYRGKPALRAFDGQPETIHAIAVHDPRIARKLERQLRSLPGVCGGSERSMANPRVVEHWIDRLEDVADLHGDVVDWRSVRVGPSYALAVPRPVTVGGAISAQRIHWR